MELIIVTGLSGAGKSHAMHCLEDFGYYCVDNMPPQLMQDFINLAQSGTDKIKKAAFVVDTRGGRFFKELIKILDDFDRDGVKYKLMFLEATDSELIRRYKETRRAHPMARGGSIMEGISRERKMLKNVKKRASIVIDTTGLKTAALNSELRRILLSDKPESFNIAIMSFGYKYGIPAEADFIFDARFIPNPFYVASLKKLSGNNKKVRDYVMRSEEAKVYVNRIFEMLDALIPGFIREGKYNIAVAIGCTGGQHRSVTLANELASKFETSGRSVRLKHRDI